MVIIAQLPIDDVDSLRWRGTDIGLDLWRFVYKHIITVDYDGNLIRSRYSLPNINVVGRLMVG